jgi:hypothetical protein
VDRGPLVPYPAKPVRARPVEARLFSQVLRNGMAFTSALLAMDSANSIFQNVFAHDGGFGRDTMGGGGDMLEQSRPLVILPPRRRILKWGQPLERNLNPVRWSRNREHSSSW